MKIGILTYHSVCNFGANLQTLSTYAFFKKKGIDVIIINWLPRNLEDLYKRNISTQQQHEHQEFVDKYLRVTKRCFTSIEIRQTIIEEKIDAVIIGSDAVFSFIPLLKRIHPSRKTIIGISKVTDDHKFPNPFWGDFKRENDSIKIFAMSASAQYLDLSKCFLRTKKALKKSLEQFEHITVRDRWTQCIISKLTNQPIEISPDPVFAFNQNVEISCNQQELASKYNLESKYIILSFCKHLYPLEWYHELYNQLKKEGFQVVNLAMPEGCIDLPHDIKIDVPLSPTDWYHIIRFSSGYIGQRMHPMIVAIHNNVPFYIFDHYVSKKQQLESSKIYDLLERSDLLRYYCNTKQKEIPSPVSVTQNLLSFEKSKTIEFNKYYLSEYNKMMQTIISKL